MTVERGLRALAGVMTLVSLALAHWLSPWWLLLTALVGFNLLQSAFTNWCPAMPILRAVCSHSEGGVPAPGRGRAE